MSLPRLHPMTTFQSYIRGDVTIHPNAAIASGVILQAEPGSRIIIAAGVCVGMGAILHVYEGTLEIEEGASLGAGALIIGQGQIGTNACIGSMTTIFNASVPSNEVIQPHSLIGETGRQVVLDNPETPPIDASAETELTFGGETPNGATPAPNTTADSKLESEATETEVTQTESSSKAPLPKTTDSPTVPASALASDRPSENTSIVYGQDYINHLLTTLLPHRQALNRPADEANRNA